MDLYSWFASLTTHSQFCFLRNYDHWPYHVSHETPMTLHDRRATRLVVLGGQEGEFVDRPLRISTIKKYPSMKANVCNLNPDGKTAHFTLATTILSSMSLHIKALPDSTSLLHRIDQISTSFSTLRRPVVL